MKIKGNRGRGCSENTRMKVQRRVGEEVRCTGGKYEKTLVDTVNMLEGWFASTRFVNFCRRAGSLQEDTETQGGVGGKRARGEGEIQEPRIKMHDVLSPAGIQPVFPYTPATTLSPLAFSRHNENFDAPRNHGSFEPPEKRQLVEKGVAENSPLRAKRVANSPLIHRLFVVRATCTRISISAQV